MSALGSIARPFRDWLGRRGIRTVMHKNRGQRGFAGITASWRADDADSMLRCGLASIPIEGRVARFLVVDEDAHIQRDHAEGRFYEPEELAIIAEHFKGGTFVDVGSNVGNHAVYAGLVLRADRIVAVEPNPDAARLCEYNLSLNDLGPISHVYRCGLSDAPGRTDIADVPRGNLGGARLRDSEAGGSIELMTGDQLLQGLEPSFLKIDTEGFEVRVLRGMSSTLGTHKPTIFIEVERANRQQVGELLAAHGYAEKATYARYPGVINCLYEHQG